MALVLLLLLCVCSSSTLATPEFDPMFNDGAVLQMAPAHPAVWGRASAGKQVALSLDGVPSPAAQVPVGVDGRWVATLPPQAASFNRTLEISDGDSRSAVVAIVSFGHVVLCSGQSNMAMAVGGLGVFHKPNKTAFAADNGTAESAASGRFTGKIWYREDTNDTYVGPKRVWRPVSPATLPGFSAVCWYAGKSLFEQAARDAGTEVPLGLIASTWGATPIEYWLPQTDPSDPDKNTCEVDEPQCVPRFPTRGNVSDSAFFDQYVRPLAPYTVSALIWDQAERDVKCPKSLQAYACMQKLLIESWRTTFNSGFAFVAVQLAGYIVNPRDGPLAPEQPGLFEMRLQQERGCVGMERCAIVPTYDVSCSAGVDGGCPFGSVHQPHKIEVGRRVGLHLGKMLLTTNPSPTPSPAAARAVQGPTATYIHVAPAPEAALETDNDGTVRLQQRSFLVSVGFDGGSAPFTLRSTRNCTSCCDGNHTVDFDASIDGQSSWANGTSVALDGQAREISFRVVLPAAPKTVRHTAATVFPQCALYNAEGLPLLPFTMAVSPS